MKKTCRKRKRNVFDLLADIADKNAVVPVELGSELARSKRLPEDNMDQYPQPEKVYTRKDVDDWCEEWLAKWYAFYETIPDKENWGYHWIVPSEMHADAFVQRCDPKRSKYLTIAWGDWTDSPFDPKHFTMVEKQMKERDFTKGD